MSHSLGFDKLPNKLLFHYFGYIYLFCFIKTHHGCAEHNLSLKYSLFHCCSYLKDFCSPLLKPSLLSSDRPPSLGQPDLPVCNRDKRKLKERLSMTFVFPLNGKNSTPPICRLTFVRGDELVCVCRDCFYFRIR